MNKKTIAFLTASFFMPALAYADEKPAKTAIDVADQALTMLSGAASKISDMLQKTAPEVWRIMIRQQYTEAIMNMSLAGLFLFVAVGIFYTTRNYLKIIPSDYRNDQEWKHVCKWFIFAGILATSIIFVCNIAFGIGRFINPEYYAIQNMFELAKG